MDTPTIAKGKITYGQGSKSDYAGKVAKGYTRGKSAAITNPETSDYGKWDKNRSIYQGDYDTSSDDYDTSADQDMQDTTPPAPPPAVTGGMKGKYGGGKGKKGKNKKKNGK